MGKTQTSTVSREPKIIHCPDCNDHPFQDVKYGKRMRVMNWSKKHQNYRCTVCGFVKGGGK